MTTSIHHQTIQWHQTIHWLVKQVAHFTLTTTRAYLPGMHTAIVKVPGCPDAVYPFEVAACEGSGPCPDVDIIVGPEGECMNGQRPVTITAIVTPNPLGTLTSASLVRVGGAGPPLASTPNPQGAQFRLSTTSLFPPGQQFVAVNIDEPAGCGAKPTPPATFTVSPCQSRPHRPGRTIRAIARAASSRVGFWCYY
jgi:hypothetical protein